MLCRKNIALKWERRRNESSKDKPLDYVDPFAMVIDGHQQSQRYYEKKRAEGKKHNQAIRALGRHLCRVIFKMLSQERPYRIDP